MSDTNNPSAFPSTNHGTIISTGMGLRDYFAAKAMQSICNVWPRITPESTAKTAYEFADAMLRAREAK
jgi:hypothetical protein